MKKDIYDKLLLIMVILLGLNLLIRLIDHAQLIGTFPLDTTNDLASYLAMASFFAKAGFHGFVANWYNGFTLFDVYPPGWYFFFSPFLRIFKNINLAAYSVLLVQFVLGYFVIWILCKTQKLSFIKSLAFFMLFFANPNAIGYFIRQGALPPMFAWILVIAICSLLLYFKNKKLNAGFLIFIPLLILLLYTHQAESIFVGLLSLGLVFNRKNIYEIAVIFLSFIAAFIFSLPWSYLFIVKMIKMPIFNTDYHKWLLDFSGGFQLTNIFNIVLPLALFFVFYFYWKQKNFSKSELIFFSPLLFLSLLFLTKLVIFIPFIKNINPDAYQMLLVLFIVFFFLKIDFKTLAINKKKIIMSIILLIPLITYSINFFHTPFFQGYTETETNAIGMLDYIDDSYIILGNNVPFYAAAFYSYAAIFADARTPSGWAPYYATLDHWNDLNALNLAFNTKDYSKFIGLFKSLKTKYLLVYRDNCEWVRQHENFSLEVEKENLCLLKIIP